MKRVSAILLLIMLLAVPAAASLPCDTNGDGLLTEDELAWSILSYLEGTYFGKTSTVSRIDLLDAVVIRTEWNGSPLRVADGTGATVVLDRPLRRVVVFNGETLETMRSIGFPSERIVGIDKYSLEKSTFFPEFSQTPSVGSVWSPDYEKVLSLDPDAVFVYGASLQSSSDEIAARIAESNPEIRVFRFDLFDPRTYAGETERLGVICSREEGAAEFLEFYEKSMDTVTGRLEMIPADERIKVYFENWKDYKSCGGGSGFDEKINLAGGQNIFADQTIEYPEVDPEAVIARNPCVIIKQFGTGGMAFGGYDENDPSQAHAVLDGITSRPGWSGVDAVSEGRVHMIHVNILGGPSHFIAIAYLASWFYPDEFEDLDPASIHQEYLTRFQRIDFNVSQDGILVYP